MSAGWLCESGWAVSTVYDLILVNKSNNVCVLHVCVCLCLLLSLTKENCMPFHRLLAVGLHRGVRDKEGREE